MPTGSFALSPHETANIADIHHARMAPRYHRARGSVAKAPIDPIELPQQARPREPATGLARDLLRHHRGARDDLRIDGDQLAVGRLRADLDRARGLEQVHEEERVG